MRNSKTLGLAGLLCMSIGLASANGDLVIVIDNVFAAPGSTATVGVSVVSNDLADGDVISGFNLPTDFNVDGFNDTNNDGFGELPPPFSLNATPLANAIYTNTGLDMPQTGVLGFIAADAITTGNGSDVAVGLTPVKLFDLQIDVDAAAMVGDVLPISIFQPPTPFDGLFNIAGGSDVAAPTLGSAVFGSVTVTPEPATAFGGVLAAGLLLRRRR